MKVPQGYVKGTADIRNYITMWFNSHSTCPISYHGLVTIPSNVSELIEQSDMVASTG